jgi:hypothetical protein
MDRNVLARIYSFAPASDALDYIVRLWALHVRRCTMDPGTTPLEAQDFQEIYSAWFSLPSFEPIVLAEYHARWAD